MSFSKIGALKFSGMTFLDSTQNYEEVERFRENRKKISFFLNSVFLIESLSVHTC